MREHLAKERTAKAKLADENKERRKINEVLAGEVDFCWTYHTTNAAMASNYSGIVYHAPPTFHTGDSARSRMRRESTTEAPMAAWCRQWLGAEPTDVLFQQGHLSQVTGLRLSH